MPAALPAPIRRAAAHATLKFDWLVPDKPFLRVGEVVAATEMRTTFVEEWAADHCHRYNNGGRKRDSLRIPRAFVIELLVKSAKYDAETKLQAVASTFREFDLVELHELQRALAEQIRRKI